MRLLMTTNPRVNIYCKKSLPPVVSHVILFLVHLYDRNGVCDKVLWREIFVAKI